MRHALPFLALAALSDCTPKTPTAPSASPAPAGLAPAPTPVAAPGATPAPAPAPTPEPPVEGKELAEPTPVFAGPVALDRLAVYPITLSPQEDIGPVIPLDEALRTGVAEVREVGAEGASEAAAPNPAAQRPIRPHHRNMRPQQRNALENQADDQANEQADNPLEQRQVGGGGATVNTLVIDNRGDVPIFVLAGTVVKGGKQDRQIGQDFIVQAKQSLPVDAFCVEQGRWEASRQGALTGGRFSAAPVLATSKVRAAGQYKKNQQAVWSEVAETNKVHGKSADSGTLFATLDDADIAKKSDALVARIEGALGGVTPREHLVGFAWAVDGRLQGVRWFAHQRLFALARTQLVRTAAVDTLTAAAAGAAAGALPPSADEVMRLLAEVESQEVVEKRSTDGANDNEYRESGKAWGAKTMLKSREGKKAKPVAYDYIMK